MKKLLTSILLSCFITACQAQQEKNYTGGRVGGACEGCEAIYEWGDKKLTPVDTLPGFGEEGPRLKLTGTVYRKDGKTPAKDVLLYIYHTNQQGIYPTKGNEKGWAKRHGYLRGWIKTTEDGKYTFYTSRPGIYPDRSSPAHIHATIKEPGLNEYYIDDYEFDDDPFVNKAEKDVSPRAGSGLVSLRKEGDILIAERDIILGLNIPDYE